MGRIKIAIWGAGFAGQKLATKLQNIGGYHIVCFIVNDDQLAGGTLKHIPIIHERDLHYFSSVNRLSHIFVAIPSLDVNRRKKIRETIQNIGVPYSILNEQTHYFYNEKPSLKMVNGIDFENLFGRDAVSPDEILIRRCIERKTILITGAGGSIGMELVKQASMYNPKLLLLVDISELATYEINKELTTASSELGFQFMTYTRDVKCKRQMETIFEKHAIDTVFHAAAYKHLPNLESDPASGMVNNVIGTKNIIELAIKYECENFTLISTDKAVKPSSKMGVTKKVCEELCVAYQMRSKNTKICSVRFGNVVGSSGSVIPLFLEQISKGGPVTVTHPEVCRYFMSIEEAAQLVIQSSSLSHGGEIFLLDMGKPVKILDLAQKLINQQGYHWYFKGDKVDVENIEIQIVGIREGEKLFEELFLAGVPKPTEHPKIFKSADYNGIDISKFQKKFVKLLDALETFDEPKIKSFVNSYLINYKTQEL